MRAFVFDLRISPERLQDYYRGAARHVVATTHDGLRVQFAAAHLQRHVTREGVRGTFRLVIDDRNDFVSLDRVDRGPA
ncbi:MAG: DUF2835 domain-containing protein [Myxococcales bacterium]|nr:DUF2835 domain-containing protein [Myxococcales bacterium]